ncbi:MAG: lytic transglycosylase domain-containing protein, partial [Acetobacteraceae bacterium]|nr:lytic transglycosylase domain-containing protein [Acetobacteraceae bacterium]MDW8400048.1 lytic transglycosylase domain-containing protein [Acetobacteraceae bacterium]
MAVPTSARRPRCGAIRAAALACALLALAACGGGQLRTHGAWQQPASYDPPGPPSDPWGPYIRQASQRFDVPEAWIREVMRQESGGRPNATSRAGAMGLMQVMPGTYRELQARYGLGPDPYHPWNSIMAGTAYIREMYELYGNPGFLAAYNAGPRRFEDYLWGGRGLPNETRHYVARIAPRIAGTAPARRAPPEIYAAAEIPFDIPPGPRSGDRATMLALRDQRSPPPPVRGEEPPLLAAGLPGGPVVAMEPIEDGRPVPATALAARTTPP